MEGCVRRSLWLLHISKYMFFVMAKKRIMEQRTESCLALPPAQRRDYVQSFYALVGWTNIQIAPWSQVRIKNALLTTW